jgi:hypothetical protein
VLRAALRPGHICSIFPKTHNAARRNMIAGGAAYRYWALKSPVSVRPRELEKGSTIVVALELFRGGGINAYLIDSPDFHGLSSPPRWGRFVCGLRATSLWRSQLALKPASRQVGFKGIEPVAPGAFRPAQPVISVNQHW